MKLKIKYLINVSKKIIQEYKKSNRRKEIKLSLKQQKTEYKSDSYKTVFTIFQENIY